VTKLTKLEPTDDCNQNTPMKESGEWPESMAKLLEWFINARDLPEQPFSLCSYERIPNPEKYYEGHKRDIDAGPKGPRSRYGAIQSDLRRLKESCEQRID